jgi:type IV secretion system protein VirB2
VGHKTQNRLFHLPAGVIAFGKALLSPRIAATLATVLLMLLGPQLAHAEPWDAGADSIVEAVRSVMRPLAILAIIACGIAAAFGQLAFKTAGLIAAGIFITVGADAIYDFFSAAVT